MSMIKFVWSKYEYAVIGQSFPGLSSYPYEARVTK